jgi:hypothetical protein
MPEPFEGYLLIVEKCRLGDFDILREQPKTGVERESKGKPRIIPDNQKVEAK